MRTDPFVVEVLRSTSDLLMDCEFLAEKLPVDPPAFWLYIWYFGLISAPETSLETDLLKSFIAWSWFDELLVLEWDIIVFDSELPELL